MPGRRRVDPAAGAAALDAASRGDRDPATLATAVRFSLEELAARAPGGSVEVRVPPFGVAQCGAGPRHTRGTPPNVVEATPEAWIALATGGLTWEEALASGGARASGARASLADHLPL